MQNNTFKFILMEDGELLIGEDTHHFYLLDERFGIDYFPPDVVAIGTGVVHEGVISGIGFDFGATPDRAAAMEAIKAWGIDTGYDIASNVKDLYHKLGAAPPVAFVWDGDQLHIGASHPAILNNIDPGEQWYEFPAPEYVYGWVSTEGGVTKARIHSDFYDDGYDPSQLKSLLAALRTRWNVEEVTYGPDDESVEEADAILADPRYAVLQRIDKLASR